MYMWSCNYDFQNDTEDADDESHKDALFKSPADIFRHFSKVEPSDKSSSSVDHEASKKETPVSPTSTMEKGVKWSANLVEFSDGSKSQTVAAREPERKSDQLARRGRGRGRGRGGGKRGNGERPKEPTKPPMV